MKSYFVKLLVNFLLARGQTSLTAVGTTGRPINGDIKHNLKSLKKEEAAFLKWFCMWGFYVPETFGIKFSAQCPLRVFTIAACLEAFQEFRTEIIKQPFEVSWLRKIHQVSAKICTKASPDMLWWNLTTVTQTKPKHTSCMFDFNYFRCCCLIILLNNSVVYVHSDIFLIIWPLFIVA